jgi:phosphoribosylformylglycinamidine cyclo-ligase
VYTCPIRRLLLNFMAQKKSIGYQDAGVSIDEADRAVASIRTMARKTFTSGVLTDIGSFGGGFLLKGYKEPVLISSADGVGTKLKLAFLTGRHSTIGEDLVNHCVNDIAVQGAVPLFFLDYFAVGKLDAKVAAQVISGIARGCEANRCALIGGETAEMPGFYAPGEYDLAGFIVGAVERRKMLTGAKIRSGDVLIGLPSTGLHTNGYSLARKLLFEVADDDCRRTAEAAPQLLAALARTGRRGHSQGRSAHYRWRHHGQHSAHFAQRTRRTHRPGQLAGAAHLRSVA